MSKGNYIDEQGNIFLRQGDSFEFVVNGLPTDQNYKIFFAAQDKERNPVGGEVSYETAASASATIYLAPELTDLFVVDEGAKSQIYYYGVKLRSTTGLNIQEATLAIGGLDNNTITVYPRKVKGDINE